MELEEEQNSQINCEQKEQSSKHQNSVFQVILQSYRNKNIVLVAHNRHIDQWNRIEDMKTNLSTLRLLILR